MEEQLKALQAAVEDKLKSAVKSEDLAALKAEIRKSMDELKMGVSEDALKAAQDDFNEKLKAQWKEVEKRLAKEEKQIPASSY